MARRSFSCGGYCVNFEARQPKGVTGTKTSEHIRFKEGQRRCDGCRCYLTQEGYRLVDGVERCRCCSRKVYDSQWYPHDRRVKVNRKIIDGSYCILYYPKKNEPIAVQITSRKAG